MIQEKFAGPRTLGFAFIALTCLAAFVKMRSLEPKTNIILMTLSAICIVMNLFDFLVQFNFVGNSGWRQTEPYEFCYGQKTQNADHRLHQTFCKGFLMIYYFHAVVYLFCLSCFSTFLFTSAKLLRLTSYVASDRTYRVELEDEIEDEE